METFASQLLSTLVALAFVGVLAWLSIALLKRLQQGRSKGRHVEGELRFIRALPVGAKERVVVVQYGGDEWLLGVTPGGISLLSRQPVPMPTGSSSGLTPGSRDRPHGADPRF